MGNKENYYDDCKIKLHTTFLGSLRCTYDGHPLLLLSGAYTKAPQLFLMLAYHSTDGVSRSSVQELLYPDGNADFANSFKALVFRLRKALSQETGVPTEDCVTLKGSVLRLGRCFELSSDVDSFRNYLSQASRADSVSSRIDCLSGAAEEYGGEFLPSLATEPWVIYENTILRRQYTDTVQTLIGLYKEQRDYEAIYAICRQALSHFPCDEHWAVGAIDALLAMGRYDQAMVEYESISNTLFDELGVYPSEQLLDAMRRLNDAIAMPAASSEDVKVGSISFSDSSAQGAYYCNYPNFLDTIRMLIRIRDRSEVMTTLMLISVTDINGNDLSDEEEVLRSMSVLRLALNSTLRSCDMFTRCDKHRLLVFMWGLPRQYIEIALKRIRSFIQSKGYSGSYHYAYSIIPDEVILAATPNGPPLEPKNVLRIKI